MDTFTTLQNDLFVLSPITIRDGKRLIKYVQFKPLFDFVELKEHFLPEAYQSEYTRLLQLCSSKSLNEGSPEVEEAMRSNEGACYLIYLSVAHKHPQITLDQLQDGLTPAKLLEVFQQVMVISGMMTKKKEAESPTPLTGEKSISPLPSVD